MSLSIRLTETSLDVASSSSLVPDDLILSARTWNRDSHDLFDFEAQQLSSQRFRVPGGRNIDVYRVRNEVVAVPLGEPPLIGAEYICSLVSDKVSGAFSLDVREGQVHKPIWGVVKDNWPSGVRISEGDIIKLGRFKLRVRQLCTVGSQSDDNTSCSSYDNGSASPDAARSTTPKTTPASPKQHFSPDLRTGCRPVIPAVTIEDAAKDPSISQLQCRICLSEGPMVNDPLVCPCECAGSIRYVHAECLGHWLKGRLGLENHTGPVYFYRPLACELCHCSYPSYFDSQGTPVPLTVPPETKAPFAIFENVGGAALVPPWAVDSSNTYPGGLHVVRFDENDSIKIGRGHDCDMRVSDVSISRLHAMLRLGEDGHVYLEDQKAKFGTLFDPFRGEWAIPISQDASISLQSGRTVIALSICKPSYVGDDDTVFDADMVDCDEDDPAEDPAVLSHERPHTH